MRAPISASRLQARVLPSLLHTCIWLLPVSDSSSPSMTRSWRRQARGAARIASRGACLCTWLSIYLDTRRGLPGASLCTWEVLTSAMQGARDLESEEPRSGSGSPFYYLAVWLSFPAPWPLCLLRGNNGSTSQYYCLKSYRT